MISPVNNKVPYITASKILTTYYGTLLFPEEIILHFTSSYGTLLQLPGEIILHFTSYYGTLLFPEEII
jgi:hypothetical protein